ALGEMNVPRRHPRAAGKFRANPVNCAWDNRGRSRLQGSSAMVCEEAAMGSVIVSVVGSLLGVLIGAAVQQIQASRNRGWQREDSLSEAKRSVYAEYLRSISASYGQAMSGQRSRTEDGRLYAATAEIEVLASRMVSVPSRDLADEVIKVHSAIAAGA